MSTTAAKSNTSRATFVALNHEWAAVHAGQPVPAGWAEAFPGVNTLDGVLDYLKGTADADTPLLALITLTQSGDETAGRTLLQTMLGKLHQIGRTAISRGLDDAAHEALLAFYTAAASYPLDRDTKVASNLSMRCLHALPHRRGPFETSVGLEDADSDYLEQLLQRAERRPEDPTDELVTLLTWAMDEKILAPEQIALLGRRYLASSPLTSEELARDYGVTPSAMRKRCSAAIRTLSEAVIARS